MIAETLGRFFTTEDPPSWLIDVGVGLGREAHELKALWPNLQVVGLEPNSATFAAVKLEGYPGHLLPYGAWSEKQQLKLLVDKKHLEWGSVYATWDDESVLSSWCIPQLVEPEFNTLDELIGSVYGSILWLDVEGAELEALRGAQRMLKERWVSLLNIEVRPKPLYAGACTEAEVDSFLAAFGYAKQCTYNRHGGSDLHWDAVYTHRDRRRTW